MYSSTQDFAAINLDSLQPQGFDMDDMQRAFTLAMLGLKPCKIILDKCYLICRTAMVPDSLKDKFDQHLLDFINMLNDIEKPKDSNISTTDFFNRKKHLVEAIQRYGESAFEISTNNSWLQVCTAIMAFQQDDLEEKKKTMLNIENAFRNYTTEAQRKISELELSINDVESRSKAVLKEIQDKAAKTLVSNYAKVFTEEANENRHISNRWLIAGVVMCLIAAMILLGIFQYDWLKSSEKVTEGSKIYFVYDYSKLISKFLLVSIFLFLISYSFKKYSVYKHLQTINRHRQNALNSYRLFTESVIGDDPATRNSLMLQVAKAIYEQTTTGFLPIKDSDSQTADILEVTKIIGNGKS